MAGNGDKESPGAVPANFDPVAEVYDETREGLSECELSALTRELDNCKTLEIAVGTGRLAKPLQERGIDITGIDVSTRMLGRARAKRTANLVRGDVTHLPFKAGSFDAVLTVHFLHLIQDWPSLIREVARTAKNKMVGFDTRTKSAAPEPSSSGQSITLHDFYLGRLEKNGFMSRIRPHGELRLADKVKPVKTLVVDKSTKNLSFDKALDLLEKRTWAITWAVPEGLHTKIVQELRTELSGKSMDFTYESILFSWRISDLARAEPYL